MNDKIEKFTFYRNYYELVRYLPDKERLEINDAIFDYIFEDIEPTLEGLAYGVWINLKMPLDKTKKNIQNGQRGGRPITDDETQIKTEPITQTETQNESEQKPNLKSKAEPKQKANNTFLFLISNFIISNNYTNNLKSSLEEWLKYKQDIKNNYKSETSVSKLLSQIKKNVDKYGEDRIIELIDESIANGWKGIIFDKLKEPKSTVYKTKSEKLDDFVEQLAKERGEL